MTPQVSVIIPAYNAESYLATTLASVQQQTVQAWELLIIDDGSCDRTCEIAATFQAQDPRIRLLRQTNQGVSVSRNRGVAESQAEIIAFLDADDQWVPHKLQAHLAALQVNPKLGVSFAQVEFMTPTGEITGQRSNARLSHLRPEHFLRENPTTTTSNWVIRRAVWTDVGGFCPTMNYSEDLEWLLRVMCTHRWEIEGIPQVLTRYRTSIGGLSSDLYQMEAGWNTLVHQACSYAPDLITQHFAQAQAIHLRYLARRAFRLRLPGAVGWDFMSRALQSDASILWREPRRTMATLGAVMVQITVQSLIDRMRRYRLPDTIPK